jgi:two-component system cell cycle response regulator
MTARVLVVDDVLPNAKLLEAKLVSEYFDVMCATSGPQALEIIQREQPDIVLLDVMMPGMDGFEVCKRIKENPKTDHIPVVMVTALDKISDRMAGLEAGADDFLSKPVKDIALYARVRSLVRLKVTMDEYRNREATESSLSGEAEREDLTLNPEDTYVLLVEENKQTAEFIRISLAETCQVTQLPIDDEIAERAREKGYDLVIISLTMRHTDGLRICSQLRSFEETRQVPILVLVNEEDTHLLVRAMEMGVNDYLINPTNEMELVARVRTQLKRKRFADRLRENLHLSLKLATTDAVTGLYNRHYMSSHLDTLFAASKKSGKPMSLALLDIDHFKSVNDTHGHAAGDEVLAEFARRIARNVRGVDLPARYGGEEFVVIMPETRTEGARLIAERLRTAIEEAPFEVGSEAGPIEVTVSVGLASTEGREVKSSHDFIELADGALYKAKEGGRNRVVVVGEA